MAEAGNNIISINVESLACVKSSLDKALKDLTIEDECRSYSVYPAKDSCLASAILLYFAQSLYSAKLRELTILCQVDFPIQYSKHAHIL